MSPLQKIAMGMVIVLLSTGSEEPTATWQEYDLLPDPVGWLLVVLGTLSLARTNDAFAPHRWVAALAGVVSVLIWFPELSRELDSSGEWAASLPQLAFCLLLAREIGLQGASQAPPDEYAAKRFGLMVWGFAALALLPVVVLGGEVRQLEEPTAAISMVVNVVFVYFLFRVHRREWLGGPGPMEVHHKNAEGRPPSS